MIRPSENRQPVNCHYAGLWNEEYGGNKTCASRRSSIPGILSSYGHHEDVGFLNVDDICFAQRTGQRICAGSFIKYGGEFADTREFGKEVCRITSIHLRSEHSRHAGWKPADWKFFLTWQPEDKQTYALTLFSRDLWERIVCTTDSFGLCIEPHVRMMLVRTGRAGYNPGYF